MQDSMSLVSQNQELIAIISDKSSSNFVDLPKYNLDFKYPVSIELVEYVGQKAYQDEYIDPIGFLCILGTKIYTTVRASKQASSLGRFIIQEDPDRFKEKTSELIKNLKRWETNAIGDNEFSQIIEKFCLTTQGVRLPVISFFLRMLQPKRFATLDIRATNALMTLGFKKIKQIPTIINKSKYFQKYTGVDYLNYNKLLTEIGDHYQIRLQKGKFRVMNPSEVDMALYMFDKLKGRIEPQLNHLESNKKKIDQIMAILNEIAEGVYSLAREEWAIKTKWSGRLKGSANKLMRQMKIYAEKGDLDGIFRYYQNALGDDLGRKVGMILRENGMKSLESEYEKVRKIYTKS